MRLADTEIYSPDLSLDEDSQAARAYHSQDFEWETLRDEIERMHKSLNLLEVSNPGRTGPPELINEKKRQKKKFLARSNRSSEGARGQSNELEIKEDGPVTSTSWEAFHVRHSRNIFFKERRYLTKEFPELGVADKSLTVLEIGCGTGSSVVPILKANKEAVVYACDCSAAALKKAVEVVSTLGEPSRSSFYPFICDISLEMLPLSLCCRSRQELCCHSRSYFGEPPANLTPQGQKEAFDPSASETRDGGAETVAMMNRHKDLSSEFLLKLPRVGCCAGGLDIVTMIFTLSAVPVEKVTHVLLECLAVLKPGGLLLFRDYGLYDMTMLRFAPSQQVSERLYQRGDGTLSYFFSLEVVRKLFISTGFVEQELEYCCVQLKNQRKQLCMKRVWVHAKFQKPLAYRPS